MTAQPELFTLPDGIQTCGPGCEPDPPAIPLPEAAQGSTERDMLDLLHLRYSGPRDGNGQRYACAEHVRNGAGFDATRTADFVAMDLWPSKGLHLHGHEVKVSRADWLRELADPGKAAAFMRYMDHWWLAVPDERIVREDLPEGWGLLVRRGSRLVAAVAAPRLNPEPVPRGFLAPLLRAAVVTADRRAERRAYAEFRAAGRLGESEEVDS